MSGFLLSFRHGHRVAAASLFALAMVSSIAGAQSYSAPESVEYHPRLNRHLVGNRGGGGSIQSRSSDGTVTLFTADPVDPLGIELLNGTLFVLDSRRVKGYNIDSAAPVMNLELAGATFLNGITSNGVDTLYVSDFSGQTIYTVNVANLAAPTQSTPVSTGSLVTPNGVVYDSVGNRLLIATWGSNAKVLSMDLSAPAAPPTPLINTTLSNIDGITLDCRGAITVAAWGSCGISGGCLRRFDPPFTLTSPAQIVANGLSSPADIDYSRYNGTVGVPENGANRVTLVPTDCEASIFGSDFEQ